MKLEGKLQWNYLGPAIENCSVEQLLGDGDPPVKFIFPGHLLSKLPNNNNNNNNSKKKRRRSRRRRRVAFFFFQEPPEQVTTTSTEFKSAMDLRKLANNSSCCCCSSCGCWTSKTSEPVKNSDTPVTHTHTRARTHWHTRRAMQQSRTSEELLFLLVPAV